MCENEHEELRALLTELKGFVCQYGSKYYQSEIRILENMIECLDSGWTKEEKEEYVVRGCKSLYRSRGGLSEFYIPHDEYAERLRLNAPLDELRKRLWEVMEKYGA